MCRWRCVDVEICRCGDVNAWRCGRGDVEIWSYRCCKVMPLASLGLAIQDQKISVNVIESCLY